MSIWRRDGEKRFRVGVFFVGDEERASAWGKTDISRKLANPHRAQDNPIHALLL